MILAPNGFVPGSFPNEIGYAYGPSGPNGYLCPYDAQYNTQGEPGMYHDTPLGKPPTTKLGKWLWDRRLKRMRQMNGLGSIPTDAELAWHYGYTPVNSGWIASNQGYVTGPWVPPNGWRAAGAFGPPTSLTGPPMDPNVQVPASAADVLAAMNAHNDKVFTLTLASVLIGGIAAMLTIVRTVRDLHE